MTQRTENEVSSTLVHVRAEPDSMYGGPHVLGLSILKLILSPVSMLPHEMKSSLRKRMGAFPAEMLCGRF